MLLNYVVLNVPIHHYLIQEHFNHKMFHNIRQGLSLSMLIFMSMMVAAATIFPSPVEGFGFFFLAFVPVFDPPKVND